MISGSRHSVNEIFALLGCYAACISSHRRFGTTYRFRIQGSRWDRWFVPKPTGEYRTSPLFLCTSYTLEANYRFQEKTYESPLEGSCIFVLRFSPRSDFHLPKQGSGDRVMILQLFRRIRRKCHHPVPEVWVLATGPSHNMRVNSESVNFFFFSYKYLQREISYFF